MNDSYEFIDAEKETRADHGTRKFTVTNMCDWLGVSTSGYYEWRDRVESVTAKRRAELGELVQKSFDDSEQTYGHRRVHAQLLRWGQRCTLELVRRIMRGLGLEGVGVRTRADPRRTRPTPARPRRRAAGERRRGVSPDGA